MRFFDLSSVRSRIAKQTQQTLICFWSLLGSIFYSIFVLDQKWSSNIGISKQTLEADRIRHFPLTNSSYTNAIRTPSSRIYRSLSLSPSHFPFPFAQLLGALSFMPSPDSSETLISARPVSKRIGWINLVSWLRSTIDYRCKFDGWLTSIKPSSDSSIYPIGARSSFSSLADRVRPWNYFYNLDGWVPLFSTPFRIIHSSGDSICHRILKKMTMHYICLQ